LREGSRSTAHLKTPQRGDCKRAAEKKKPQLFFNCKLSQNEGHLQSTSHLEGDQAHLHLHADAQKLTRKQKCVSTNFCVRAMSVSSVD
jgi:hypothetical protein